MAKTVLKVPVDTTDFAKFETAFKNYNALLVKQPGVYGAINKENKAAADSLRTMTAALMAQQDVRQQAAANENKAAKAASTSAFSWSSIARHAKETSQSVATTTARMLKWPGIVALMAGVAGVGGSLWGIDRLAYAAAAGRRSSQGLGVSYGEQQAFGLTYGRLVDTGSFMGGISTGRGNVASQAAASLSILGINPSGSGSNADVARQALDKIRALAKTNDEGMWGSIVSSHGLGEFGIDVETMRRLNKSSDSEYEQFAGEYTKRRGQLNVSDPAMKASQDLAVQLDVAGQKIKNVLIESLARLAPVLTDVIDKASDFVKQVLAPGGIFHDALNGLAAGLQDVAKYLNSPDFKRHLREFGDGIKWIAGLFGFTSSGSSAGAPGTSTRPAPKTWEEWQAESEASLQGQPDFVKQRVRERRRAAYDDYIQRYGPYQQQGSNGALPGGITPTAGTGSGYLGSIGSGATRNNPGNIIDPRLSGPGRHVFLQFATPEEGLRAMHTLGTQWNDRGDDTIRKLVSRWAPPKDANGNTINDTEAYIRNVENWTGINQNARINMRDPDQASRIMSAKIRQEGGPNQYTPGQIRVVIENNTGGNATISTNQIAY